MEKEEGVTCDYRGGSDGVISAAIAAATLGAMYYKTATGKDFSKIYIGI